MRARATHGMGRRGLTCEPHRMDRAAAPTRPAPRRAATAAAAPPAARARARAPLRPVCMQSGGAWQQPPAAGQQQQQQQLQAPLQQAAALAPRGAYMPVPQQPVFLDLSQASAAPRPRPGIPDVPSRAAAVGFAPAWAVSFCRHEAAGGV